MEQAEFDSTGMQFARVISDCTNCLKVGHTTIVNLLADGVTDRRVIDAYGIFRECLNLSCDVAWKGFDFVVDNDPKLTVETHEHLLVNVGNFLTGWRERLREVW
jgi:hypothetical protein